MRDSKRLAEEALKLLTEEEAGIIRLAYGFTHGRPMTDLEIGVELGIPRSTVQWRREKALSKMREGMAHHE